jgi:hypothetical protein
MHIYTVRISLKQARLSLMFGINVITRQPKNCATR